MLVVPIHKYNRHINILYGLQFLFNMHNIHCKINFEQNCIYFTFSTLDSVETSGGKILIHCQAGISRSATICLAYLMSKRQYTLEQAYEYVKARRSVISPNFHFMGQLLNWEREIRALNLAMSPDKLSPSHSQCGLFSYSNMVSSPDARPSSLHKNSCFVTVSTPT